MGLVHDQIQTAAIDSLGLPDDVRAIWIGSDLRLPRGDGARLRSDERRRFEGRDGADRFGADDGGVVPRGWLVRRRYQGSYTEGSSF